MFIPIHCEEETTGCSCHLLSIEQTRASREATKSKNSNVKQRTPRCCIFCDLLVEFLRHGFPVSCNKLKEVTTFVASSASQDWPIYIIDVDCCLMLHASPWCSADFLTSSCCLCNVFGGDTAMVWTTGPWLATPHHFQTTIMKDWFKMILERDLPIKININTNTRCAVVIKHILVDILYHMHRWSVVTNVDYIYIYDIHIHSSYVNNWIHIDYLLSIIYIFVYCINAPYHKLNSWRICIAVQLDKRHI